MNIGRSTGPWGRVRTEARARVVYLWLRRVSQSNVLKVNDHGEYFVELTEHLATRSKVRAPCVADLVDVDAILLAAHMSLLKKELPLWWFWLECRVRKEE